MALNSSEEQPQPLRVVSKALSEWIGRLGALWVEGQVIEIRPRAGGNCYLQVRDVEQNVSVTVVTSPATLTRIKPPLAVGARIVMNAKPEFWSNRGSLLLRASAIRTVGIGDLLARIELLKATLAAAGLFAAERKRALPFLPRVVGLICGRGSAAEHDVIENACRRWPAVRFEVRQVAVQGNQAAGMIRAAVIELDQLQHVDVIVITRGGGSVEDLLPFSDETLVRAVAACVTPVVSAVGHEQDTPLLDLVADLRASTPTDAARRIVPDLGEQDAVIARLRTRAIRGICNLVHVEQRRIDGFRRHPGLSDPTRRLTGEGQSLFSDHRRAARALARRLDAATEGLRHERARLASASPEGTLRRGYAIVTTATGPPIHVITDPTDVSGGQPLLVRVAGGTFDVVVTDERAT